MKGSTSLRRFCWLQVNFSYGHCPVAQFGVANGRSWLFIVAQGDIGNDSAIRTASSVNPSDGRLCGEPWLDQYRSSTSPSRRSRTAGVCGRLK